MKRAIMTTVAAVLAVGSVMASVSEANAIVCARGVYRAGCAGRQARLLPIGGSMLRMSIIDIGFTFGEESTNKTHTDVQPQRAAR
jgi:hypothetical protein